MIEGLKQKLQDEVERLNHEISFVLPKEIEKARAHGDLRENSEYKAALERQQFAQARVHHLRLRLSKLSDVREQDIPRELLYIADEVFLVGTASEVTPVRSIDRITVGAGKRGPITTQIQQRFMEVVHGQVDDKYGWLTYVRAERASSSPARAS